MYFYTASIWYWPSPLHTTTITADLYNKYYIIIEYRNYEVFWYTDRLANILQTKMRYNIYSQCNEYMYNVKSDMYDILLAGPAVDNETIDAIRNNFRTNMMMTVQRKISKSGEVISILYIGAAMNSNRFCTRKYRRYSGWWCRWHTDKIKVEFDNIKIRRNLLQFLLSISVMSTNF